MCHMNIMNPFNWCTVTGVGIFFFEEWGLGYGRPGSGDMSCSLGLGNCTDNGAWSITDP